MQARPPTPCLLLANWCFGVWSGRVGLSRDSLLALRAACKLPCWKHADATAFLSDLQAHLCSVRKHGPSSSKTESFLLSLPPAAIPSPFRKAARNAEGREKPWVVAGGGARGRVGTPRWAVAGGLFSLLLFLLLMPLLKLQVSASGCVGREQLALQRG